MDSIVTKFISFCRDVNVVKEQRRVQRWAAGERVSTRNDFLHNGLIFLEI
jgi:hypothetical protein